MDRALYSIEETRARLGGISRNSLYAMLRAGSLPSVVIGCRRFHTGADGVRRRYSTILVNRKSA